MANSDATEVTFRPKPNLPPPPNTVGAVGWARKNLFSTWYNTILTVLALWLIFHLAYTLYDWGIAKAVWEADSRRQCLDISPEGACWAGVAHWFWAFMYGRYPAVEQWRINLSFVMFAAWMAPCWFPRVTGKIGIGLTAVLIFPFFAGYMFAGGDKGLFLQVMLSAALVTFGVVWLHVAAMLLTGRSIVAWVVHLSGFAGKEDRLYRAFDFRVGNEARHRDDAARDNGKTVRLAARHVNDEHMHIAGLCDLVELDSDLDQPAIGCIRERLRDQGRRTRPAPPPPGSRGCGGPARRRCRNRTVQGAAAPGGALRQPCAAPPRCCGRSCAAPRRQSRARGRGRCRERSAPPR